MKPSALLVCVSLSIAGCDPASPDDAGPTDTGTGDSGATDGGVDAASDAGSDAGPVSDIRFLLQGRPIDVSPDGTLAVVEDPFTGEVFFYDVGTGAIAVETDVGDPLHDFSTGVSAGGHLSALHGTPVQAGVWDGSAWLDLETPFDEGCGEEIGAAWDISADGAVTAGMSWDGCSPAAIRWVRASDGTVTTTMLERLGASPGALLPSNRATVISDDGQVIAGFAQTEIVDRWPAVWMADGSGILLPGTPADAPGEVLSISADGSVVAGTQNLEAFTWSEADGYVAIGRLPTSFGADTAYPNAIALNGALVFGACGGFGFTEAFVWTEADGMRTLTSILETVGVTLPSGYTLQNILGASVDGTVLLGSSATASGTAGSFVLRLPVSAYGL